jgi:WD40 repeat protein
MTLWEHENATVWSVDFSPDGTMIASGNGKGITLWKVAPYQIAARLADEMVGSVVFSPDGSLLASGTPHGIINLWDAVTYQMHTSLEGHDGFVYDLSFSSDGAVLASAALLATGCSDGLIGLWDIATVLGQ